MNKPLVCLGCVVMSVGIAVDGTSSAASSRIVGTGSDAFWDNRISPSWPGVDGYVMATTVFDGKLIVAGRFTIAGQTSVNNIAAWDGSSWSALGSGLTGPSYLPPGVSALEVFDGKLIAAGPFQFAGDVSAAGVAAWDGNAWSPLSLFPFANASALAVFQGKLIVAGRSGTFANGIAAWDGESWTPLGSGVAGDGYYTGVYALAVANGRLIAGGDFTSVSGAPAHNVASWDGFSWSPLGEGRSSSVGSLAVYQDHVIAGGLAFASWDGSSWAPLGHDGPQSAGAMFVYGNRLIVSGRLGGFSYLASWDGTSWSPVEGVSYAFTFTIYEDRLIAGGFFDAAGPVPARGIASWDGDSWSGLYVAPPGVAGPVGDLTVFRGKLIAGGAFTSAGDVVGEIAAWDGTTWSALGSGTGGAVSAFTVFDGKLIAGGEFTEAGGVPALYLAAWNGRTWSPVGTANQSPVSALTTHDDHLIVGHSLQAYDCTDGPCGGYSWVTSWDGAAWSRLGDYEFPGDLESFATYDDRVIMLTSFGGAREWDETAWLDLGPSAAWFGGTTVHDDLLLAGMGVPYCWDWCIYVPEIDVWDGSSWSPFETDLDGQVWALTVYEGQVIAGGDFSTIGGVAANHIAAWDGERWSPLGSGTDGPVHKLAVYEGSLIVAGDFHRAGGKPSQSIAVWRKPRGTAPRGSTTQVLGSARP